MKRDVIYKGYRIQVDQHADGSYTVAWVLVDPGEGHGTNNIASFRADDFPNIDAVVQRVKEIIDGQ